MVRVTLTIRSSSTSTYGTGTRSSISSIMITKFSNTGTCSTGTKFSSLTRMTGCAARGTRAR